MTKRPVMDRDDETNELPPPATSTDFSFSVDPASGPEHTLLTLTSTDFGETPGTIALNEVPAPVVLWTPLAVQTIVPYGGKSGDLVVTTTDGRRASVPFTVTET